MQHDRLVTGLAAVLGAITVLFLVLGFVYNPVVLFVALMFGASTYFVYYHASGRMATRVYRRVERQAAQGAGGPDARRRSARAERGPRQGAGGGPTGRRQEERGGFAAGPREEWTPPRDGATARQSAGAARGRGQRRRRQARRPPGGEAGPSAGDAYRTLGLEPGADEKAVTAAYREKVKEVHPDTDGGDEESFREVQDAYERLTD